MILFCCSVWAWSESREREKKFSSPEWNSTNQPDRLKSDVSRCVCLCEYLFALRSHFSPILPFHRILHHLAVKLPKGKSIFDGVKFCRRDESENPNTPLSTEFYSSNDNMTREKKASFKKALKKACNKQATSLITRHFESQLAISWVHAISNSGKLMEMTINISAEKKRLISNNCKPDVDNVGERENNLRAEINEMQFLLFSLSPLFYLQHCMLKWSDYQPLNDTVFPFGAACGTINRSAVKDVRRSCRRLIGNISGSLKRDDQNATRLLP